MGLSRLDNFLKSARGTILYVNPNDLDATDSIENQGNSLTRPFKTIQRALIEASRFSYQKGLSNDRFNKTTILLYPGDHIVDNRPGWIPDGLNNYQLRDGTTSNNLPAFDLSSNFDLTTPSNELYKLNSIYGGVIVPRGTSIVGLDLRKTKIRPKYVPNPLNNNITPSTIFRITGGCYFWQFSLFDADPNGQCYMDYTSNLFVPNFSHHKLTCFEYADGVNNVFINDEFITNRDFGRTDLDMYYEKVGLVYGQSSGRPIEPDYPSAGLDIESKIDEYRIVGSTGQSIGISSIKSGDGVTPSTTVTVTTLSAVPGLDVDTPFRIEGITATGYNGQFVVTDKISDTEIKYQVQDIPTLALPSSTGATLSLQSDSVTSASPYIFNISLRSVYGMCGLLADGDKASGFKSVVIAQFTGIGLQKDDRAFVVFDETTGLYQDNTVAGNETISNNSRAVFKPEWRNFHIKATNNAFIQNVSIFAIGFAEQFATESGGDMSITNSNSNFGARALVANGFRKDAFPQDDLGYFTHIIPPKEIPIEEVTIEYDALDVGGVVGVGSTGHLPLYNQTNVDVPPDSVIEGYRIGARVNDRLSVLVSFAGSVTEYSSRIVMPNSQTSSEKSFNVISNSGSGILGFSSTGHTLLTGETIRFFSDTGKIPDGLLNNQVYYAITSTTDVGIGTTQIKVAKTLGDALTHTSTNTKNLTFNTKGGNLKVVSRVTDKKAGDIGHPVQYDSNRGQWYIKVASASTENGLYNAIVGIGSTALGAATPRTYFRRKKDTRTPMDTTYRVRYVIPKESNGINARPPSDAYIIQESNSSIGSTTGEIQTYFGNGSIGNVNQQRNFRFIADAIWYSGSNTANFATELPHNLSVGSEVEVLNIKSTINTAGVGNSGFNRTYVVTGIGSAKNFTVGLNTDPGSFSSDTTARNTSLPYFKRKKYKNTYYIYRNEEAQRYISGKQDGIYYLTLVNSSNSPTSNYFSNEKFSQPVKELYPQISRDNPVSDPEEAKSFAQTSLIGEVLLDDVRKSLTKETILKKLSDTDVGVGITNIVSAASTLHSVYTSIEHGLNRIVKVSIANSGAGYGSGSAGDLYNARLVGLGGSITGNHATAKVSVNSFGNLTSVTIMDGGSAYGIGNSLAVVGIATTTGYTQAIVTVTKVYNNVGDVVRVSGVSSEIYSTFNGLYRITDVPVGAANSFRAESAVGVSTWSTGGGIGLTFTSDAFVYLTGESLRINSLVYNKDVGIATITTQNRHGLKVDAKVKISGANESLYNGDFVVTENVGLTTFSVKIGVGTTAPSATGTLYAYREGVTSNDGIITVDNENLNGRMIPSYAGITTTLFALVSDTATDQIYIQGIENLDIRIGDYLSIDDEIVRVKTTVPSAITTGTAISVFRGVLGTKSASHENGAVVRRIRPTPVELRRHSISRASGHTFEYVGFGPGNYSTALPEKQDRQISAQEELVAQSTRRDGGINFYTGMNDKGISYSGNKKLSTVTGLEEIFDTPVQTITGEDIGNLPSINIVNPVEGLFSRSIRVDGGTDGKAISQFNGPVIFTDKITSTSPKGIEATSLYIQGDATVSRKHTVGISTPTSAGNPGDIVYYENPSKSGYMGWIYTTENAWYRFGNVSISRDSNLAIFDQVGIGTTTPLDSRLRVGLGTITNDVFVVDAGPLGSGTTGGGVGIGTTANGFKLRVQGSVSISGTCYAGSFSGDGSGLTALNASATGWTQVTGAYYNTAFANIGIGTSVPAYNLHLGSPGTGNVDLYVENVAKFVGFITSNNMFVSGILTATSFDLQSSTGEITAGIITSTNIRIGTAGTAIMSINDDIGIGTASPRAKLDIEGLARLKTYSEAVGFPTITSNVVTLDLSDTQTFELTLFENVNYFTIANVPSDASSFTIKILQNPTGGYTANLDDFRTVGLNTIPVRWPGGGVKPGVTTTANRSDIYSFRIFNGNNLISYSPGSGIYGIVVGQNFAD
jgi:hypothetical protein